MPQINKNVTKQQTIWLALGLWGVCVFSISAVAVAVVVVAIQ